MDSYSLSHSRYKCQYHVVFIPKYRKRIMYGKLKADVREIIKRLCDYRNIEIIEGAVCADHVHLCLSIPPSEKVSDIWEAILQPFGYLIPHMNKKTGGTEDRWRVLLSPHTERSMRMQQMTNHRPLAELDLLDDFLFNALLAYPEYGRRFCRKFLKILFGREFKNLNIVTQKSYGGRDTGLHGARLDVYIEEGDEVEIDSSNVSTIYDIEPDKNNKRKDIDFIAQRTRFYHAIIDSRSLKSGQSYDKLKKVFVIFICPYDPFGDDRMIYTIRNHCVENPELPYEDGARTIFLYTKGRKGRDNESLSQLLDYMENTTRENAVSEELEAIQEMVDVVKEDAEVTVAYMKGFERDQMFLEEGKELGRRLEQENTLREKNRADTEKNRADTEKNRADTEKNRADTEKNRADAEKHRAEEERQRADAAVEEIEKLRRQLEELQKQ